MAVKTFYTDQEIFITGGSGFIGKSLIEKIIRCLPDFGKMYVLMRHKKDKTSHERLQDLLHSWVFQRARKEQPDAFKKIEVITGDCQELGLGISTEDLEKIKNVTMIFHSAASVRFDDHLKRAILLNTRGTYELVKIAEKLPNLKAFIHVSTAYAYPDHITLAEEIKPVCADWRTTIKLAETYDTETMNIFFAKYSRFAPNSYTFTKSLAEHVINDYRHKLPVLIIRPSIVIGSVEEPVPGYIDNFNGPVGMLIACGIGIMRTQLGRGDVVSDFMPVDICSRGILLAGYKLGNRKQLVQIKKILPSNPNDSVEVINCTNSGMVSLTTSEIIDMGKKIAFNNPFERAIWLPEGGITSCMFWHYLRYISLQIIPALLLDFMILLANKQPVLIKLQRRICCTSKTLNVFYNTQWTFYNENLKNLDTLIDEDEFPTFGVLFFKDFDYHYTYFKNILMGSKMYLLHEPPVASPKARMRMNIYKILHYLFQFIGLIYLAAYLIRFSVSYMKSMSIEL